MKNIFIRSVMLGLALSMMACSSLKTRDINQSEVQKVKRVAVIAFSEDVPVSRSLALNLNSGKVEGENNGSILPQSSAETDQILQKLLNGFQSQMHWTVIDKQKLSTNPGYVAAYKKTMEGWQNKMPPGSGHNRYTVTTVMDFDSARILDVAGRDQLIKDLGVDAVIAIWATVRLTGTSIMGIGNIYPQTNLLFQVYVSGQEKPIWFESLQGEEMPQSIGKTAFFDDQKLATLSVKSVDAAIAQISEKSKQAAQ